MYVCVCVCVFVAVCGVASVCMYVCVCVYVCMYACMYVCVLPMCVAVCGVASVCMYLCLYVCVCMHVCMCVSCRCALQRAGWHLRVCMYVCVRMYICMCACVCLADARCSVRGGICMYVCISRDKEIYIHTYRCHACMATPIYMHVCTCRLNPVSKGHQVGLKSAMSLFAKETHKNRALFLCWYLYVRVYVWRHLYICACVCMCRLDPVFGEHQVGIKSARFFFSKETHQNRALFQKRPSNLGRLF